MRSKNEPVAIRAAEALLDRGYGRPAQEIALEEKRPVQIIIADAKPKEPKMVDAHGERIERDEWERRRPVKVEFV
jgi:hypothetical protein